MKSQKLYRVQDDEGISLSRKMKVREHCVYLMPLFCDYRE